MFETRIAVGEGACLTMDKMAGNLAVAATDREDILIRLKNGREEHLRVEDTADGPQLSSRASCEITIPGSVSVRIRQVGGNLSVKDLATTLNAEQVRGNLVLSQVREVALAEVYGNLTADGLATLRVVGTSFGDVVLEGVDSADLQNIRGNLRAKGIGQLRLSRTGGNLQATGIEGNLDAEQIGGNALLKSVGGALTLGRVAGNLVAKNLTGGAKATRIGGNLVLNGDLSRGKSYQFVADGNAMLRLNENTDAHLTLTGKGSVMASVPLTDQQREGQTLTGTLGEGGAEIAVKAKGNVSVGGGGVAFGAGLGEEITRQIEESLRTIDLEAIGRQVSEEMESAMSRLRVKLETVDWERVGLDAKRGVERAMERMQDDVDRMAEKAARHQARVERKAEKQAQRLERMERKLHKEAQRLNDHDEIASAPSEPVVVQQPPKPETDLEEERLSILRMVEQGQIKPEEAEMLLDALE